jgi:hypothetical protein
MRRASSFACLSLLIVVAGGAGCRGRKPAAANAAPWTGPDDVEELARIFRGAQTCPETTPPAAGVRRWSCHVSGWRAVDLFLDPRDPPGPVLVAHSVNPGQCRIERFSSRYDVAVTVQAKLLRETFGALANGPFGGSCLASTLYGNGPGGCDVALFAPRHALGRGKDCHADFHRADDRSLYRDGQTHW